MKFLQRIFQATLQYWLRQTRGKLPPFLGKLALVRRSALGDVLLTTPALRELKRLNPAVEISLYTDYSDLFPANHFLNEVKPSHTAPAFYLELKYENADRRPRHIAQIYGEQLGLKLQDCVPSCGAFEEEREKWAGAVPNDLPVIAISRRASTWTPNKDWPDQNWDQLIDRLLSFASVVEFGIEAPPGSRQHARYWDVRGKTTLSAMMGLIAHSDLYLGPISGPVHAAAALGTPAIVIYSGYEIPPYTSYPLNTALNHPVECSPCWLRTPCPHQLKCLSAISVQNVLEAIQAQLDLPTRVPPAPHLRKPESAPHLV